jgi:hypothetical protein
MYTFIFSCLLTIRNRYVFSGQIIRENIHIAFFYIDVVGEQQEFVCE